jgi:GntP family gluconate:H+ symporter
MESGPRAPLIPRMSHNTRLLLIAALAVAVLIVLIVRLRISSFVALLIASLGLGIAAGMPLANIAKSFQEGVGNVLANIAVVVGLGTILGKLLAESGGAEVIANALLARFGPARLPWAMLTIGFVVGLPVFFAVGLVLLAPILYALAAEKRSPFLLLAIPMVTGLSSAHGFVPPHPGPMAAIEWLHADVGKTILLSFIVGIPAALVAGPLFSMFIAPRLSIEPASLPIARKGPPPGNAPGFGITLFTICLPILLMLVATSATLILPETSRFRPALRFIGEPIVALLVATLFSFYAFGFWRGFNKSEILKFSEECLGPTAAILLIVGAGGGFNKILIASGVGDAIAVTARDFRIPILPMGFAVAALIRIATGSATVAITTAAGIMQPIAAQNTGVNLELLIMAMASGSTILSHLNDGGFWFVKEYLQFTVPQTLKTWTVMETILSLVSFAVILLLGLCL